MLAAWKVLAALKVKSTAKPGLIGVNVTVTGAVVPGVNGGYAVPVYEFFGVVNPQVKYALGCFGRSNSSWAKLTEAYVGAQLDIQTVLPYWWTKINTQRISCHLAPMGMMSVSPLFKSTTEFNAVTALFSSPAVENGRKADTSPAMVK